jgi:tetratricopeptide (TPR) repeat protein
MRNAKQQLIGWGLIGFIAVLALCAAGLVVLKVLPPRDQARVLQRLPAPVRAAVNNWIFPHPESVPAPSAPVKNISALLTPQATRQPTMTPTWTPSPVPSATPALAPIDPPPAEATAEPPTSTSAVPIAIPSISAPGSKQAARSTPASPEGINVLLTGAKQEYQLWNNCGPATLSMNLGFYGWSGSQVEAAKFLKPDQEDKNVSPDQMAEFARSVGFNAAHRVNGTTDLIKAVLRAGVPMLIEKGFEPEADLGWMGHYELLVGFNDEKQEFIAMDSYMGPYQAVPYAEFEKYWRQFNRTYLAIYPNDVADQVQSILGSQLDDAAMWSGSLATAQQEAAVAPDDPFAWFNLGSSYAALQDWSNAATAYDRARQLGLPWRMPWYQFGWFDAYLQTGRYDDVLALADAVIKITPNIEETYYYKGLALKALGNSAGARSQLELALQRNPNFKPAQDALTSF